MRISWRERQILGRGNGKCKGPLAACLVYPRYSKETSVAGVEGTDEVREVRVGAQPV